MWLKSGALEVCLFSMNTFSTTHLTICPLQIWSGPRNETSMWLFAEHCHPKGDCGSACIFLHNPIQVLTFNVTCTRIGKCLFLQASYEVLKSDELVRHELLFHWKYASNDYRSNDMQSSQTYLWTLPSFRHCGLSYRPILLHQPRLPLSLHTIFTCQWWHLR